MLRMSATVWKSGSYRSAAVNADAVIVDAERVQPVALVVRSISVSDGNYWVNDLERNPLSSSGAASGRLVGYKPASRKAGTLRCTTRVQQAVPGLGV
jgi:hypothetical protein